MEVNNLAYMEVSCCNSCYRVVTYISGVCHAFLAVKPWNGKGVLYVGEMFGAFMKVFGFLSHLLVKNIR
ncbi:transmembrane protein, putative [Medicago truncatula]|uniref:Transmembrane protein, putative n=1 Tax=Medicago truncatula TaxID=3880 RepID=G7J6A0_MEDTR|nr:transmembrane protein, putative [Medicago truncatula]